MVNTHILPDSRLSGGDSTLGSVICDWELVGGRTVRLEVVPVYCVNCGKPYGMVPKDNTTFVCWMCRPCFEKYGQITATYTMPDEEFCRNVAQEMQDKFGRDLTDLELFHKMQANELGTALTALANESPFKVYRQE